MCDSFVYSQKLHRYDDEESLGLCYNTRQKIVTGFTHASPTYFAAQYCKTDRCQRNKNTDTRRSGVEDHFRS